MEKTDSKTSQKLVPKVQRVVTFFTLFEGPISKVTVFEAARKLKME